jgi:signal transduction histidine kinase
MLIKEEVVSASGWANYFAKSGWHRWLISKPFDWLSTALYVGACLSLFYGREGVGGNFAQPTFAWWQTGLVVGATLVLLWLDRYESVRWGEEVPTRAAIGFLLARVGLVQTVSIINPNEITYFMYLILPVSALLYFGNRAGLAMSAAVWLTFVGRVLFFPAGSFQVERTTPFVNLFTLSLIFVMTTGYTLLREKASRARAERLLAQLSQSQRQAEELAATKERNRLARDIHDSLGHYLTVISVLLGKARAFKAKNPAEADQALEDARRLANEALQDVRESVKSLRTSQQLFSLERSLANLVAGLDSEQLQIALVISGSEAGHSKQSLMIMYRVAQEGLTNVQRHAGADRVTIELTFGAHEISLRLADNGRGFDPTDTGHGYGLQGLAERLEMVGGEFKVESTPGGTCLLAVISAHTPSEM